MHLALYRKYRPANFDDVCGQEHITSVLKYQAEAGKVSHAYLFCGSRGTGKTSSAKILAKAVNCLSPENGNPCGKCEACRAVDSGAATDVVEMDAASNNGVDNIRELRDEVTYAPAMLKRRVYIIDEVHMLSTSAFNALLKTLEEPPSHVLFILATTELHKLPSTIISRCQRFDFRRIGIPDITKRLHYIAKCENIVLEDGAAERIARLAEGGMRDAVSLLELCAGGGADVTEEHVREVLGVSGYAAAGDVAASVAGKDMKTLFATVAKIAETKDIAVFWQELLAFWRDMLVCKYAEDFKSYLDITETEAEMLAAVSEKFSLAALVYQSGVMDDAMRAMVHSPQTKRVTAEMALVKMCQPSADSSPEALMARVAELEDKIKLLSVGVMPVLNDTKSGDDEKSGTAELKTVSVDEKVTGGKTDISNTIAEKTDSDVVLSNEYTVVTDMNPIVEKLTTTNPMAVEFLRSAKVEISSDCRKVRIIPENDFSGMMLSGDDVLRTVAEAFVLMEMCTALPSVSVEKATTKRKSSPYDDLFGD